MTSKTLFETFRRKLNPKPEKIHMIAICGTGMSSLAGLLKEKGFEITGSDANIYPPMSDQLTALGIPVQSGYRAKNIDDLYLRDALPDRVIVGNAVSKDNPEVQAVMTKNIPMLSMPEAIGKFFLAERFPIVVAGTHGKTTTCGLLSWILENLGQSPGFLVGGVLKNFGRSFQLGTGDYFIIEGDEYDSAFFDKGPKFLHYRPQILILNPIEFDHADIYKDLDHVLSAFSKLIALMPPNGLILAAGDSSNVRKLIAQAPCRVVTFGCSENPINSLFQRENQIQAKNIELGEVTRFQLFSDGFELGTITSPLSGRHNLNNLLGVIGVLLELGRSLSEINTSLSQFQGMKRRQEVLATLRDITVIDDFAHHPTAVLETLKGLRARYPHGKLWAIFEPRSNTTRRKIFQQEFVKAFEPADEVLFAAPYLPEKIPAQERLDPEQIVLSMNSLHEKGKKARYLPSLDVIVETIIQEARPGDTLCFMSNGDFGGIHQKVMEKLREPLTFHQPIRPESV